VSDFTLLTVIIENRLSLCLICCPR